MIKSMTGYGRGEFIENDLTVTVEIKSVNHRFFECQIKAPRQFSFLEDKLKSYIQSRVNRGKLDVFVSLLRLETDSKICPSLICAIDPILSPFCLFS